MTALGMHRLKGARSTYVNWSWWCLKGEKRAALELVIVEPHWINDCSGAIESSVSIHFGVWPGYVVDESAIF